MVLAINIGNTNVLLGVKQDERIYSARHTSGSFNTQHDFVQFISQAIAGWEMTPETVTGVIISSVLPSLTNYLENAANELFSISPLVVNASMKMKLDLSQYDTGLIGSDRIAVCEAAITKYGTPSIVFDFGTAATINVIDGDGHFLGGSILPGLMMGINALAKDTALLPLAEFSSNASLIGKNTQECIVSGAIFGNAAMLDGMAARIEKKLGHDVRHSVPVIVTGGNAEYVIPLCERQISYEPNLLIEGLYFLYHLQ